VIRIPASNTTVVDSMKKNCVPGVPTGSSSILPVVRRSPRASRAQFPEGREFYGSRMPRRSPARGHQGRTSPTRRSRSGSRGCRMCPGAWFRRSGGTGRFRCIALSAPQFLRLIAGGVRSSGREARNPSLRTGSWRSSKGYRCHPSGTIGERVPSKSNTQRTVARNVVHCAASCAEVPSVNLRRASSAISFPAHR